MSELFTPMKVRQFDFRNRVVMPPMVCAVMPQMNGKTDPGGHVTDAIIDYYRQRAAAGTGMVIVEAAAVAESGRCWSGGLCAYDDAFLPGLRKLAQAILAEGAIAGIQLVHGGPNSSTELTGGRIARPDNLSIDDIRHIQAKFVSAAMRCAAAGFQTIEVHGAHGFLLDSFLSPRLNTRKDAYGGSFKGRMEMMVETCRLISTRLTERALCQCRISAFNHLAEGYSSDDFLTLAAALEETGIDLLHLSVLNASALDGQFGDAKTLGQWARQAVRLPLILAGNLGDPHHANRAIAEGHADFAAIGRGMMNDPLWTAKARDALRLGRQGPETEQDSAD